MKKLNHIALSSKKGAVSLYVVIFVTIFLGIITLGFTRLILSESTQTSNNDLSQSAYDSALAGVEDAKVALLKYHDCVNEGSSAVAGCSEIIKEMEDGIASKDCDTVANVLNREQEKDSDGNILGTTIQETSYRSDDTGGGTTNMLQAYTCVTIEEKLADYRSYLNTDNRVRIVPIRSSGIDNSGRGIDDITHIRLSWYSDENYATNGDSLNYINNGGGLFARSAGNTITPPIISVSLIQTDNTFSLGELSVSNGNSGTDRATLLLYPSTSGVTSVSASDMIKSNQKNPNDVTQVKCEHDGIAGFYCNVTIEVPPTFRCTGASTSCNRNEASSFLTISLPYGEPSTDFSVLLCRGSANCKLASDGVGDANVISFTGVQAKVDSTGRANDLYRRVETRIEMVDTYFPYPEFSVQMTNGANSTITKNFWTTKNCMRIDGAKITRCPNSAIPADEASSDLSNTGLK